MHRHLPHAQDGWSRAKVARSSGASMVAGGTLEHQEDTTHWRTGSGHSRARLWLRAHVLSSPRVTQKLDLFNVYYEF